jgi:hypothetical protein
LQTNQLVVGTSSYSCHNIQKDTYLHLDENISKSDYCAMQHPEKVMTTKSTWCWNI